MADEARRPFLRRPLGRLVLVAGALALLLAVLVALAPTLMAGWARGFVERHFDEQHRGRLEIGALELAWTSRQSVREVRLLDPSGERVATASVELPSLWSLATGGGKDLGSIQATASASLVADDAGVTNLERALEPRGAPAESGAKGGGGGSDWRDALRDLRAHVVLSVPELSWSDARTRSLGQPFVLAGFEARLDVAPDTGLELHAAGDVRSSSPGKLKADARVEHPLAPLDGPTPPSFQLDATLDGFSTALIDGLAGLGGVLEPALGPTLKAEARGSGTLQGGDLTASLDAQHAHAELSAQVADGVLRGTGDEPLRVTLDAPGPLADAVLARAAVPPGTRIAPAGEARPLTLVARRLAVPLEPLLSGAGDPVTALASGAALDLTADLGSWSYDDGRITLALEGITLSASADPSGPASRGTLALGGRLGAGSQEALSLQASCDDLAALAAVAHGGPVPPVKVAAALPGLPTSLVAALLGPGTDVAGVLGPQLELRAQAEGTPEQGTVELSLRSDRVRAEVDGELAAGELRTPADHPARISVSRAALEALAASALPAGIEVRWPSSLDVELGGVVVPVQPALDALARSEDPLPPVVGGLAARLTVTADGLTATDPALRKAKRELALGKVVLTASATPNEGEARWEASLEVPLADGSRGLMSAGASGASVLELLRFGERHELSGLHLRAASSGVPIALLEAWTGPGSASALGDTLELDASAALDLPADGPLVADATLDLGAQGRATHVQAKARISEPFAFAGGSAPEALPPMDVQLDVTGTDAISSLLPPALADGVVRTLGHQVSLSATSKPAGGGTELSASLRGGGLSATLAGTSSGGTLRASGKQGLSLELTPAPALVDALVRPSLPEGDALALAEDAGPLRLTVRDVTLPLDALAGGDGQARPREASFEELAASLALDVPRLVYRHGAAPAGSTVSLRDLRLEGGLKGGGPALVTLKGTVDGDQQGTIDLRLEIRHPAGFVVAEPAQAPEVEVSGGARGVPTALVDAAAAQEGLLVDTLGPTLDLDVSGVWPGQDQPARASLHSAHASLQLDARLRGQALVASGEGQKLDATVPLTPLFRERVIGKLVPMLVQLSKPEGAEPVSLDVRDFTLPLDGDLKRLSGVVSLDLNRVSYEVLPGLQRLLAMQPGAAAGGGAARVADIAPLTLRIEGGVVHYEGLPITFQGRDLNFRGSYDLAANRIQLATDVPLKLLGSKVEDQLDKVREYLDPDLAVPIEITGSPTSPRVALGKKFVDEVLQNAAQNALRKGLGDLLKKKKD